MRISGSSFDKISALREIACPWDHTEETFPAITPTEAGMVLGLLTLLDEG